MEWYEIVLKIFGALSPILTFLIGYITSKYKIQKKKSEEKEKEYAAMRESCKLFLRKSLKDDYEFYMEQGFCSIEDKNDIEAEYDLYHSEFDGNGRGTLYYKAIMSLPDSEIKHQN